MVGTPGLPERPLVVYSDRDEDFAEPTLASGGATNVTAY